MSKLPLSIPCLNSIVMEMRQNSTQTKNELHLRSSKYFIVVDLTHLSLHSNVWIQQEGKDTKQCMKEYILLVA